jgi:hypothetical protein
MFSAAFRRTAGEGCIAQGESLCLQADDGASIRVPLDGLFLK